MVLQYHHKKKQNRNSHLSFQYSFERVKSDKEEESLRFLLKLIRMIH